MSDAAAEGATALDLGELHAFAIEVGQSPDIASAMRALRRFIERKTPLAGFFASHYDPATMMRRCLFGHSEGEEIDVTMLPPMPNTGSPHSRCVETGETILTRDFQEAMAGKPRLNLGLERDARLPQSSLVVPLRARGATFGGIEAQSVDVEAFPPAIVARIEAAVKHVAYVVDRLLALERSEAARLELVGRATALERKAQDRLAELAAKNRELEAFSFTAAHDLRAPLRAMLNLTAAVLANEAATLSPRSAEDLRAVVTSTERMADLVEDLLRFARTAQGALNRGMLDMSSLAREMLAELQRAEPDRKVDVEVQQNLFVEGDPALVRILLDNLIGNAWKYSRKAGMSRIRVGARLLDGDVTFYVADNGVGFTPDQAKRVFLAFERLQPNEFEGTGVGLATAQRIVERHGGRIWAEGRPGAGATFYFTLRPPFVGNP